MPLTPQQLADFQRLRQSYAPVVEAQRRKQKAYENLEKMHGLPPVKPQSPVKLAIGGQGPKNWIKGTVEKVIEPLLNRDSNPAGLLEASENPKITPHVRQQLLEAHKQAIHHQAMNQWVERNLTNYIKKQMATHDDPIRKLAEQGIIHMPTDQVGLNRHYANDSRRMMEGTKLAKSPEAEAWEDAADVTMGRTKVKNVPAEQREPWMEKADPETHLYFPQDSMHAHYLGFDHLMDILKEDLAQGRIRPEQLSKISIEQAVRRVHQYDQERKKAMAETALKATEGMPVHKEYPEGYKWIELTTPPIGNEIPLTHQTEQYDSKVHGGTGYRVVNKETGMKGEGYKTPERATSEFLKSHAEDKLAEALKYEGDTMGHCVGGYTPDVASGKSRIFSLRDAKNEPHVTIEVKPNQHLDFNKWWDEQPKELRDEINARARRGEHKGSVFESPEYLAARATLPPAIKQIKGKGNAKPKKDYIPYVQDFVKLGNWSNVGDINNAEMRDIHPESDLAKAMQQKGLQAPKYVTEQEMSGLLKEHNQGLYSWKKAAGGKVSMAKGGKVTHAHHLEIEERPL